uniref:Venom allergen 5.01 n=1 Tax=Dolichovespula maculata TaxID=7441 RepID=VA52_DOLMA|nr:RecName: Full=Venom allergen 5.01; AltName: Full=Allergen Dol m V-A; AltName: Full=Antigen 5 form 2; Short=Ag5-2; AltName: Full=Cysteine-rich venom protein; Short=CRVP; AltName: Allergen=Dol m 5.01; Flags: Precursor [Dolichovespula maculata]AAA28301.1 antigen 5 precursor [Dolichovespula maculata]
MEIGGLVYLILIITIINLSFGETNNYCKIKCRKGIHTLCKFGTSMKPNCGRNVVKAYGLTNDEKNEILKRHNDFRQNVAKGLETRGKPGPQPPAKNMNVLVWNDELAKIAQTWANQCDFNHDDCRNTAKYQVGQNIAISSTTATQFDRPSKLIKQWEDEVTEFNYKVGLQNSNFRKVGHYTQMVWGKTKEIGCGSIKYIEDNWYTHYLVCNYGPGGNDFNQPIYERK